MNKALKKATSFELFGLAFMWFGIVVGSYVSLSERAIYSEMGKIIGGTESVLRPSTYVFLLAIVGFTTGI